ncbi:unnamed protein product [Clonostachys solani]|uniref:Fungal N-terminal domain-containing protein n=1 Tax=Clonostachys solani TaxID=160281 RepID=A0A9P0EFK1_9HYPO|nr:unnamed protein product [Clonostachys solani]
MEVLGAVASAATLAQIAVKGVEFLQKIPEIQSDYAELCDELEFIETIIRHAQQTSTHSEKTTSMPGIQDQIGRIVSTLTEISRDLDEIKVKCQHQTAKGDVRVSKKKWVIFSGKIGGMLQKAHRAKTNLQMAIGMHMSTLHHQTSTELREVKSRLDISLPGIERQLDHMSHAAMVMISTREKILNAQTEKDSQRIHELDDEGNELDSNDTSAATYVQGSTTPDAPPQSLVGQITALGVAFQRTKCPAQCECRCHTRPRKVSSPEWIKKLSGSWELQYKPQLARTQWDMHCPCNKTDDLEIAWRPPEWWWIQSSSPRAHRYSLKCALRPVRVLRFARSEEYRSLAKSVADVRQAMDRGMILFPDDMFEYGINIVEVLVAGKNFQVLEFLLLQWKNISVENGLSRITGYRAAYSLRFDSVGKLGERLLEQVVSYVDWGTDVTTSAIHEAAIRGSGVQESCVEAKDLIDAWDETGHAPLHHAVMRGHTQAVQDLIDAGADVNCKSFQEETPLMLAAHYGHTECMRSLLLTRRINRIDEQDRFNQNALGYAANKCNPEAVRLLLEEGASPLLPSRFGHLPLHWAIKSDNQNPAEIAATINLLLDAPGTDINATDYFGDTAIMEAVWHNNHVALRCLARAGPSFTAMNKYSHTLLHYAARCGDLETLHFLDGQELTCINWKLPGELGWTPWMSFMHRLDHPERKPDPAEMIAFVQLYRGIRDRDLAHDFSLLEQTLAALDRNDEAEAHLHLSAIIHCKEAYNDEHSARFYRGIRGNLSSGDKETLLDNIQADLQDLRLEMASSPWDQDALDESDSDESSSDSDESASDSDETWSDSEDSSGSSMLQEGDASDRDQVT